MKKRTDPRMHTAEHILNQTMVRMYDCGRCFSAHNERKKSKCDYRFDHQLTKDEIKEIQSAVNSVIESNMTVNESFVTKTDAERLYNTEKLPDHVGDDQIRIIHVGDYDACPCIGEHVSSTGEIGSFRITTSSFEDSVLRIRFKLSQKPA